MSLVLKELEIIKHPLLKTEGKLTFSDGINLLVGKNGSGKTRMLEFLAKCVSFDFSDYPKDELHVKFSISDNESKYSVKVEYHQALESVGSQNEIRERSLIYGNNFAKIKSCKIEVLNDGKNLFSITANNHFDGFYKSDHNKVEININKTVESHLLNLLLSTLYMDSINEPEVLTAFDWLSDKFLVHPRELFGDSNKYYDLFFGKNVELEIRSAGKLVGIISQSKIFEESLDKIEINSATNLESKKLIPCNDFLLKEIAESLDYQELRLEILTPSKKMLGTDGLSFSWNLKKNDFTIKIDDKTTIDYDELSYGEKRFTLLFFYIYENSELFLDEPIDGLHHSMIEDLVEKLSAEGKQSFIANQSPVLFDYVEFDSKEQVLEKLVVCKKDEDKKLLFSNPTKKMADGFYKDYERNFLQVSEILRHQEIW